MTKYFSVLALAVLALFIFGTAQTAQFNFTMDIQGWVAEDWGNGAPILSHSTLSGGCLQADISSVSVSTPPNNWANVYLKGALDSPTDLTSTPVYSLDVFVPNTMWVKARLSVNTSGGWAQDDETAELKQGGWQTLTWDMSGAPDIDLGKVTELGVEIKGWYPSPPAGIFKLDNVITKGMIPAHGVAQ